MVRRIVEDVLPLLCLLWKYGHSGAPNYAFHAETARHKAALGPWLRGVPPMLRWVTWACSTCLNGLLQD